VIDEVPTPVIDEAPTLVIDEAPASRRHLTSVAMPMTILVVDDDPVIQKLLTVNFEMEGYRVVTAGDGQEGLDQVAQRRPDIILLDVMMPKMDGVEVVRRLKADADLATIPVIMLSAKAQSNDISGGLDAGADDYITKPFDPLELLDKVAALLGPAEAPT
jgi:DNA-binding response OmpR family regulator